MNTSGTTSPASRRWSIAALLVFTVLAHVGYGLRNANPWRLVALDSLWTGIIVVVALTLAWPCAWLAASLALRPGRVRRIAMRVLGTFSGCYFALFVVLVVTSASSDEHSTTGRIGKVPNGQLTSIYESRTDPSCPDIDVQYDGGLLSTHRRFFACGHQHHTGPPTFALRGNVLVETWDADSCTYTVDAAHLMLTTSDEACDARPN